MKAQFKDYVYLFIFFILFFFQVFANTDLNMNSDINSEEIEQYKNLPTDENIQDFLVLSKQGYVDINFYVGIYYYNKFINDDEDSLIYYHLAKKYYLQVINEELKINKIHNYINFNKIKECMNDKRQLILIQFDCLFNIDDVKTIAACDYANTEKLKKRVMSSDYPELLTRLAKKKIFQMGSSINIEEGMDLLNEAIKYEYSHAYHLLYLIYSLRDYHRYDKEKAKNIESIVLNSFEDLKKEDLCNIGKIYYLIGNYEMAEKYWQIAGNRQDATAQYNLALMYYKGNGVEQDFYKAFKWFTLSAEQGVLKAQLFLGYLYDVGKGVEQNYQEAIKWYTLAANQGNIEAQYILALMYYEGDGVKQDYQEAIKWCVLAAKQGHAAAQVNLGYMYHMGYGTKQDEEQAYYWYKKSAMQGNFIGQNNLGCKYFHGEGVAENKKLGMMWYLIAKRDNENNHIEEDIELALADIDNKLELHHMVDICIQSNYEDCHWDE